MVERNMIGRSEDARSGTMPAAARNKGRWASGTALAFGLMIAANPANAVEGGVYGAPLGGTDARQAYLPEKTGVYGGLVGVASLSDWYTNQYGSYSTTSNPGQLNAGIAGAGLLYVYPWKPLDFTVASSIQFQYIWENQALTVNGKYLHGFANGFQDSYSDLFYASRYLGLFGANPGADPNPKYKYGLTWAFGLAAELPIGAYNVNNFVNPGKNTYITIANTALTYLTGPNLSFFDGTELSARFFFDTNKRNPASGYQGGNLIDLDYAITERYKNLQFGLAGDYAQQIQGDRNTLYQVVAPNGDKYEKIDLGPVFLWDMDNGTTFKFKATFPVYHENNYNSHQLIFVLSRKLL